MGRYGVTQRSGRGRRAARTAGPLLLAALSASGCAADQLRFRNDHRLEFSSPAARAVVTTPLTVSWTMRGFRPVGLDGSTADDAGAFAVFLDRAPMPVGEDLRWLARDDSGCLRDPRCPDRKYLADHGVYVTTDTRLVIEVIPRASDGVGNEQHYVNVVLVNGKGARIGESAWYRPFQTARRSS